MPRRSEEYRHLVGKDGGGRSVGCRPADAAKVVRQAQSLGLVELPHLAETMRRLGPRRGSRSLSRIIATGPAPTRSELEDVVLDLMLDGGIAPPDVNLPLVLGGRRVVPDFRWPEQNLVVEADGAAWHDHRLAREDDAARQALLEAYWPAGPAGHVGPSDRGSRHDAAADPRRRRAARPPSVDPCRISATKSTLGPEGQWVMWKTNLNLVPSPPYALSSISPRALR